MTETDNTNNITEIVRTCSYQFVYAKTYQPLIFDDKIEGSDTGLIITEDGPYKLTLTSDPGSKIFDAEILLNNKCVYSQYGASSKFSCRIYPQEKDVIRVQLKAYLEDIPIKNIELKVVKINNLD